MPSPHIKYCGRKAILRDRLLGLHVPSEDSATEAIPGHAPSKDRATAGAKMEYRPMYRRNLPHYQPKNGLLFVTFRLNFAIPAQYIKAYHDYRESLEAQLDIK